MWSILLYISFYMIYVLVWDMSNTDNLQQRLKIWNPLALCFACHLDDVLTFFFCIWNSLNQYEWILWGQYRLIGLIDCTNLSAAILAVLALTLPRLCLPVDRWKECLQVSALKKKDNHQFDGKFGPMHA